MEASNIAAIVISAVSLFLSILLTVLPYVKGWWIELQLQWNPADHLLKQLHECRGDQDFRVVIRKCSQHADSLNEDSLFHLFHRCQFYWISYEAKDAMHYFFHSCLCDVRKRNVFIGALCRFVKDDLMWPDSASNLLRLIILRYDLPDMHDVLHRIVEVIEFADGHHDRTRVLRSVRFTTFQLRYLCRKVSTHYTYAELNVLVHLHKINVEVAIPEYPINTTDKVEGDHFRDSDTFIRLWETALDFPSRKSERETSAICQLLAYTMPRTIIEPQSCATNNYLSKEIIRLCQDSRIYNPLECELSLERAGCKQAH